jgi:hypothetical protein
MIMIVAAIGPEDDKRSSQGRDRTAMLGRIVRVGGLRMARSRGEDVIPAQPGPCRTPVGSSDPKPEAGSGHLPFELLHC